MSDATPGRADLQKKDRGELQTIITALGGKPSSRAKKDDLISMVLELTGGDADPAAPPEISEVSEVDPSNEAPVDDAPTGDDSSDRGSQHGAPAQPNRVRNGPSEGRSRQSKQANGSGGGRQSNARGDQDPRKEEPKKEDPNRLEPQKDDGNAKTDQDADDDDQGNRRRRRRGRGRDRDEEQVNVEPQAIGGNLDLREEGYGFLRVDGALPSPEDVYVPLKTVRLHGLRKGDHVAGTARPAARNERNAALHSLDLVNDKDPALVKGRPRFENQTPVFPTEARPFSHGRACARPQ